MDNTLAPLFAAGGFIGLFSAAALLIVQNFREAGRLRRERAAEIKDLKGEVEILKHDNFACRLQVNSLITLLQQGGIPLPDWLLRDNGGGHEPISP